MMPGLKLIEWRDATTDVTLRAFSNKTPQ